MFLILHQADVPARLRQRHQSLAAEAGIRPQNDFHLRPAKSDLSDDPFDLFDCAGARIDVQTPQLGAEQMPAAENVERQMAIAIVIAVEEAAFLMAMQRVIGRVEVDDDLALRFGVSIEKQRDEETLDRGAVDRSCDSGSSWPRSAHVPGGSACSCRQAA